MAKIYYRKITNKDINFATGSIWTIDDVPTKWRDEVLELLQGDTQNNGS